MSQAQRIYASIVSDIEALSRLREKTITKAFDVFESHNKKLANVVCQINRDRRSAAFWMCSPLRRLGGRHAYQVLAEGEEDCLWDELNPESMSLERSSR
ncbi:hypothetical protein [Rhodanobacter koreensis]